MSVEPTQTHIQELFDTITPQYDKFNRLSSLGQDMHWRRKAIRDIQPGMRVLDVGTGSGDLALQAMHHMKNQGHIIGIDFSQPMLDLAQKKQLDQKITGRMEWLNKKAEEIPFNSEPYDAVISGFVLRNLFHHISDILRGIYIALKPGGFISFLDLTEPDNALLRAGSHLYLNTFVRMFSWICFKNSYSAEYLSGSMKRFFRANEFKTKLEEAGFVRIQTTSYLFGSVTHYQGYKP